MAATAAASVAREKLLRSIAYLHKSMIAGGL